MVAAAALSIGGFLVFMPYTVAEEFCLGWLARACLLSGGGGFGGGVYGCCWLVSPGCGGPSLFGWGVPGDFRWMGHISAELKFTVLQTTTDFIPVSILFLYFYLWC